MNLATFQAKIIDYAMQEIIPNLPTIPVKIMGFEVPISSSLMQFGAGVGLTMSAFSIEKFIPQLQAFGVLDEENRIDVDKLSNAFTEQIRKVEKINIGKFEFDENDVVKFLNYLNS